MTPRSWVVSRSAGSCRVSGSTSRWISALVLFVFSLAGCAPASPPAPTQAAQPAATQPPAKAAATAPAQAPTAALAQPTQASTAGPAKPAAATPDRSRFEALLAKAKAATNTTIRAPLYQLTPEVIRAKEVAFAQKYGIQVHLESEPGHVSNEIPPKA